MSFINSISGFGSSMLKNLQPDADQGNQGDKVSANDLSNLQNVDISKAKAAIEQLKKTDFSKAPDLLDRLASHIEGQFQFGASDSIQPGNFSSPIRSGGSGAPTLPDMFSKLVDGVNAKGAAARDETVKLMSGETDNIHQSIIALQEAGVAFTLLVEVRNKLVESYQELMRMQV